ncbi:polypeptide N-acetylgalactosaminyltransferase 11-like [Physella acuta]|uniref:polypeptide N-acetylgalactosaminyltransferase 11-like n=1 Tax=Physella acuta TaxID=109671 RepID=UPI0027DC2FDE|nr:polypeptide N-acetylgalactosaminyltransferase 11-like [Physella acuta]XP_059174600.1 polypeptide N-acetylgalactosaminyltransferase 11-like [Physella acuta]XP_059174601.1 polypeptide N-acetylgalactosaminyltransferase 11-like [Physella acuta]
MLRIKQKRLVLALVIFSAVFWFFLYWNLTSFYAYHKSLRAHQEQINEIDIYSELYLANLATVKTADDQRKYDAGYHAHAFNQMLSDRLSYTRPLPDFRNQRCKDMKYSEDLPSVSVIICFYNEAMSALLRTVHTVLLRSPAHLIHEIILVDDNSDFAHLKTDLEEYIRSFLPKVKLFHTTERLGLIRARMYGAKQATAEILLFLDSHCEVNIGWLEPLLAPIHQDSLTVSVPIMDIIDADTFFYAASDLVKGGFNWGMHYQWEPLTPDLAKKIFEKPDPYDSPTMAGGLFAMNRQYFHQLGEYDKGMNVWGGENLELSFRIWQCGGRLVIVPCSRVGHIFRKRRPYGSPVQDSFTKNTLRMVHVWLDDYKRYYFHINSRAEDMEFGNINERLELRKKLNCKSFHWYLENIYPEQLSKLPDLNKQLNAQNQGNKDVIASKVIVRSRGLFKHASSGLCVTSEKTIYDKRALVHLDICKPGDKDQLWFETEQKDLRLGNVLCLDLNKDEGPYARLMKCKGSNAQTWIWSRKGNKHQLMNFGTSLCLKAMGIEPGALIKTEKCSDDPLMLFTLVIT